MQTWLATSAVWSRFRTMRTVRSPEDIISVCTFSARLYQNRCPFYIQVSTMSMHMIDRCSYCNRVKKKQFIWTCVLMHVSRAQRPVMMKMLTCRDMNDYIPQIFQNVSLRTLNASLNPDTRLKRRELRTNDILPSPDACLIKLQRSAETPQPRSILISTVWKVVVSRSSDIVIEGVGSWLVVFKEYVSNR